MERRRGSLDQLEKQQWLTDGSLWTVVGTIGVVVASFLLSGIIIIIINGSHRRGNISSHPKEGDQQPPRPIARRAPQLSPPRPRQPRQTGETNHHAPSASHKRASALRDGEEASAAARLEPLQSPPLPLELIALARGALGRRCRVVVAAREVRHRHDLDDEAGPAGKVLRALAGAG